jgi:hypothetical protein
MGMVLLATTPVRAEPGDPSALDVLIVAAAEAG